MSADDQIISQTFAAGLKDQIESGSLMNHFILPEEEREAILKRRAARLARKLETGGQQEGLECIEFGIGADRYAVETQWVKSVMPLVELTPIPCTPDFVLGVTYLRSRLISVIDLKAFMRLPKQGLTDQNRLMILRNETMEVGILTDLIEEVRLIYPEKLAALPETSGYSAQFMMGINETGLRVIDGHRILTHPGLMVRETV